MTKYPIKMLLDEKKNPFFPVVTTDSVLVNGTEQTAADLFADRYTKAEIDKIIADLGTLQRLCGKVDSIASLPNNAKPGDTYIVTDVSGNNSEYMYIGDKWEELGPMIDLSGYDTSEEVDAKLSSLKDNVNATSEANSAEALKQAKQYTDTRAAILATDALTDAKAYTDEAIAHTRNELNQRIDAIPVINPQDLVDNGFDYSYEDPSYVSPITITVELFGNSHGFTLGDDGYYTNNNKNIDASYAMCKIVINNSSDTNQNLNFKVYQQSENMYNYGIFSELNKDLVADINDVSTNVAKVFQQLDGETNYSINVPSGESYITVKYRKDGSSSQGSDTFKFKLNASSIITAKRHMATTEYVNSIVGKVNTELESIINGGA